MNFFLKELTEWVKTTKYVHRLTREYKWEGEARRRSIQIKTYDEFRERKENVSHGDGTGFLEKPAFGR